MQPNGTRYTTFIERPCERCDVIIRASRWKSERGWDRFCSAACRRPPLVRSCKTCGTSFRTKPSVVARGSGNYCSIPCRPTKSDDSRFWKYVEIITDTEACWGWKGATDQHGYGRIWSRTHRRPLQAQRMSWELHHGPIPEGLWVLHHCDNPPCVRPDHLFLGTRTDNVRDMHAKGRYPKRRPIGNWVRGRQVQGAKLTEESVGAIREAAAKGVSAASLGREYGVYPQTIGAVIKRRTWRHVP